MYAKISLLILATFVSTSMFSQNVIKSKPLTSLEKEASDLRTFLDSIAFLPVNSFNINYSGLPKPGIRLNRELNDIDFNILKKACSQNRLHFNDLHRIFPNAEIDKNSIVGIKKDSLIIRTFQFDNITPFTKFAIALGDVDRPWGCELYFFKRNEILEKHTVMYRFELNLKSFIDENNKTIVYYTRCSGEGAGVAQFNYCFYKFEDDHLVPFLDLLELATFQWSIRWYFIESSILNYRPLTIKFNFNTSISQDPEPLEILNDTSIVVFHPDPELNRYIGDYNGNKIDAYKLLTFYTEDIELLFINQYSGLLEKLFDGNKNERAATLFYLDAVKNGNYAKNRH